MTRWNCSSHCLTRNGSPSPEAVIERVRKVPLPDEDDVLFIGVVEDSFL